MTEARPADTRGGHQRQVQDTWATHTPGVPTQVGRFLVRERLGAGAFGAVYRAYDPQLDREVALKVPHPSSLARATAAERFLREGKAAARLRHPHIVPVHEAGFDGAHHYIVTAFIEGCTLAQAEEERRLDFRRAAEVVRDLAEALAYAHAEGVVHRDVKPANIMLDRRGAAYLMDFGLAHCHGAEKLTQLGSILGTPAYMAPEQAAGQAGPPSAAGDQYSLGVVLYELLCGRVPFSGAPHLVLYNVLHQAPPPPRAIAPAVPPELERNCLKAMAKRPEDRYPSCQEFADDLRRWLQGEPTGPVIQEVTVAPVVAPEWGSDETPPPVGEQGGLPVWVWAVGGAVALVLLLALAVGIVSVSSFAGKSGEPSDNPAPVPRAEKRAVETAESHRKAAKPAPGGAVADAEDKPGANQAPPEQPASTPGSAPKASGPAGRIAVPDEAAVEVARKELRKDAASDLAQADPQALQRLAQQWIERAYRKRDAPAMRLALLRGARDVALRAEHVFLAQRATDEIVRQFAIAPLRERVSATEAAVTALGPGNASKAASWAHLVLQEAVEYDEYDLARRAAAAARSAATTSPAPTKERVERTVRRAEALCDAFERVRRDMEALAARPGDPAANAAVGRFWCFKKGDWGRGLPLLARGGDDLAALARQDLAGPIDPAAQRRLADLWWECAEKQGEDGAGPRRRARFWYLKALPRLSGLTRAAAVERTKVVVGGWRGSAGWVAEYFTDAEMTHKAGARIEYVPAVSGDGAPPGAKAVRWTGWLWPADEGYYSLSIQPKGGTEFRFYQNGRALKGRPGGEYEEGKWLQGSWSFGLSLLDKPQQFRLECRNVSGPLTVTVTLRFYRGPHAPLTVQTEGFYHDAGQAKALGR